MKTNNSFQIHGLASNTIRNLRVVESELELSLLDFLHSKNIGIASSCSGDGVCEKCVVNDKLLSCQIKIKDVLTKNITVSVDYL